MDNRQDVPSSLKIDGRPLLAEIIFDGTKGKYPLDGSMPFSYPPVKSARDW